MQALVHAWREHVPCKRLKTDAGLPLRRILALLPNPPALNGACWPCQTNGGGTANE